MRYISAIAIQPLTTIIMVDMHTENPWENAASDENWNQANFSMDQKAADDADTFEENPAQEEVASRIVRYLVNSWHFADTSVGLAMIVYGVILGTQGKESKALVWTLFILGGILLLRAAIGTYSVYSDFFGRLGMLLSAYMSTVMSFVLFIVSMVSLGMRQKIAPYLSEHQAGLHLSGGIVNFLHDHVHFVWAALLICCGVEALRWISLVNYRAYLLEEDEISVQLVQQPSRRHRKPWWWSTRRNSSNLRDDLADPLLGPNWAASNNRSYQMDHGLEPGGTHTSTSMWSIFGSRRAGDDGNVRDDTSVDFASVQDDWASRSEEDPLWWAREEG